MMFAIASQQLRRTGAASLETSYRYDHDDKPCILRRFIMLSLIQSGSGLGQQNTRVYLWKARHDSMLGDTLPAGSESLS